MQKTALVCGAGGFIGHHLVKYLKNHGYKVTGVDLKYPEFSSTYAHNFLIGDLRNSYFCNYLFQNKFSEVYQLAADMGGAGYIFSGDHDANIMHNSATINLNILEASIKNKPGKIFFSSSACIYPAYNQTNPDNPNCSEDSAYPAAPDSEYGWEKLFSERMYLSYFRNYGLKVRIARFHNIFGPEGTWNNGKEKAPAAICRKIAESDDSDEIEIWGDGNQTRSFLFINECLEGIRALMDHPSFTGPVNIGSNEMVSINQMVDIVSQIANKKIKIRHIEGPQGVRGRNSDNALIEKMLHWSPSKPLSEGLAATYLWINEQVSLHKK
jgi:GDP-D-mannose 3', 5'-epimerase